MEPEDQEEENKGPKPACSGLRKELLDCLRESDCVRKVRTDLIPQILFLSMRMPEPYMHAEEVWERDWLQKPPYAACRNILKL